MVVQHGRSLEALKRMRFLLLHPNFPGQFKHLAAALASSGHEVKFLCQTHFNRSLPGWNVLPQRGGS